MYKFKIFTMGSLQRTTIIRQNADGSITSFGEDLANTDYQAYLAWLAEGNTPEPAEEQQ
jgi:hypothetical protein